MGLLVSEWAVDTLLVAAAVHLVFLTVRRWSKDRLVAAAAAQGPASRPEEAADPASVAQEMDSACSGCRVLTYALAVAAAGALALLLSAGGSGLGGVPRRVGPPLQVWMSLPIAGPLGAGPPAAGGVPGTAEPLRFQWWQLGTGDGGRVPVIDCAQWSLAHTAYLLNATLAPLPPLTPAVLADAQLHTEEEAERAMIREARDKALTRRCIVSATAGASGAFGASGGAFGHLLQHDWLSQWVPTSPVAAALAAGNYTAQHVAILRNGSRFYPVGAVRLLPAQPGPAASGRWAFGSALLSEEELMTTLNQYIHQQQEHSGFGLKPAALDRCICPAFLGVFGSGLQLHYAPGGWHLWQQAVPARVVTAGCGGQGCVGNQTYAQTKASAWPSNLLVPLQELGPLSEGGIADVLHYTSIVVAHYDLAATMDDPLWDHLHVNALEPHWVDSALPPSDVSAMAAVFDVRTLVTGSATGGAKRRETPPLDHRDSLCFATCATLEAALTVVK